MELILDGDYGIDDAIALLWLAGRPEIEIVAVGAVHGNTSADRAAANAVKVLGVAGLASVPVASGADRPLAGGHPPERSVHGADGLGGLGAVPAPPRHSITAAEQISQVARARPGRCTVLATGPLTNLASALLRDPDLADLVPRVVVMGGALEVAGNVTSYAEFNIWMDPEAADLVLGAGWPVTLVGLDVTMDCWLGPAELSRLEAGGALARFCRAMLDHYVGWYRTAHSRDGCPLHDPTAACLAVMPQLASGPELPLGVELGDAARRGALLRGEASARRAVWTPTRVDSGAVVEAVVSGLERR